jgi:hypothetical protein
MKQLLIMHPVIEPILPDFAKLIPGKIIVARDFCKLCPTGTE